MRQSALLIKPDGTAKGVTPLNGGDFSLEELQGLVEAFKDEEFSKSWVAYDEE